MDPTPAPWWTGVEFTCEKCGAVFQLEAADKCIPALIVHEGDLPNRYNTPACWNCDTVNTIEGPVEEAQFPS